MFRFTDARVDTLGLVNQNCIGWGHIFRGRLSSKWGQAQELYYQDNPDTRGAVYYTGKLWASQTTGQLIEISLMLWDTRNKLLHGATLADQNKIQREWAIQIVVKKFAEGTRNIRRIFPRLYLEPCNILCDRSTLQLLKWIETYDICMGASKRDNTKKRQGFIQAIKRAFHQRTKMCNYGQIILFAEPWSTLCKRNTDQLGH